MRASVPLLLLAAAAAGCLGAGDVAPGSPTMGPRAAAFDLACPPGDTRQLPGGLCVGSLWDPRETYEEPWLAAHPARPGVMALGLNAWHADPRLVLGPQGPGTELVRMIVFVTEDGGATWRAAPLPGPRFGDPAAVAVHGTADPALAFDAEGVLHVTQLNAGFSGPFWFDVQYTSSADLGRTWSEPLLLAADGDNDRNWLRVGPDGTLWASWRNPLREPLGPQVAWSRDGGRTWSEPTGPEGCTHGGQPLPVADGVLLTCEVYDAGQPQGIALHHLDAAGAWTLRSTVPEPPGWAPGHPVYALADVRPDGALALVTRQGTPGAFLAASPDGGRSWAPPVPLAGLCGCGGAERLVAYWAEFDPWGGLHVLLRDGYLGTPDQANEDNARYARNEMRTWHLVVDVDGMAPIQETLLVGPDPGFRRVPQGAALPIGRDDYYKPAFWDGGGALAWTRDKGTDFARLQPRPQ